jgi:hypothetical protein
MQNKRRQGNMTPQKDNDHKIGDLVDSEMDDSSVAEVRRMMIKVFNQLKENIHKQFNESQENMDKKFEKTQKQLMNSEFQRTPEQN